MNLDMRTIVLLLYNTFKRLNVEFKDGLLMKLVYFRRLILLPQTLRSKFKQILSSYISIVCKTFNKHNFKIFPSWLTGTVLCLASILSPVQMGNPIRSLCQKQHSCLDDENRLEQYLRGGLVVRDKENFFRTRKGTRFLWFAFNSVVQFHEV